jgi:hypothetical protein
MFPPSTVKQADHLEIYEVTHHNSPNTQLLDVASCEADFAPEPSQSVTSSRIRLLLTHLTRKCRNFFHTARVTSSLVCNQSRHDWSELIRLNFLLVFVRLARSESQNTKDKRKKPGASGQYRIHKMYLNMMEKVTTRRKEDDPDFMFPKSLLPIIKKLGPLENLDFRGDVIQLLRPTLTSASPVQFLSNRSSVQSRYDQYSRPSSAPGSYTEFSI